MHSKVIISWTLPDNGLRVEGPVVFNTTVTDIETLITPEEQLHSELVDAIENTSLAASLFDDWENGDWECEYTIDEHSGVEVVMIAISTGIVSIVLVPGVSIN